MTKIPKDNQIQKMLDPASPALLFQVFSAIRSRLQQSAGLFEAFQRLGGYVLIAPDGTEYFCSDELHCENCSTRQRKNGKTEYFHAMLAATLVAPGHDKVLPLVRPAGNPVPYAASAHGTSGGLSALGGKSRMRPSMF